MTTSVPRGCGAATNDMRVRFYPDVSADGYVEVWLDVDGGVRVHGSDRLVVSSACSNHVVIRAVAHPQVTG